MKNDSVSAMAWALLLVAVHGVRVPAADWPQFLGEDRNGVSKEQGLVDAFPASGPVVRWRIAGGVGMSAVSVQGGLALTTWNAGGQQLLVALDAATGKMKWKTPMGNAYENPMGDGPRATPTIANQRVYAYSGEGILVAADL